MELEDAIPVTNVGGGVRKHIILEKVMCITHTVAYLYGQHVYAGRCHFVTSQRLW